MSNPFDLYSNTGSGSGMASGLSNFGLGSSRTAAASVPKLTLPTTAGDIGQSSYGMTTGTPLDAGGDIMPPNMGLEALNGANSLTAAKNLKAWQGLNGFGKMMYNQDGSFDLNAAGSILSGLGGLGSLYLGFQANKTAKDTLDFKKRSYEENMANQISSFNMALEDKARTAAKQNGESPDQAEQYINKHKL